VSRPAVRAKAREHASPASRRPKRGSQDVLVSLPLVGPTTMEDIAFYGVIGTVAALRWMSWPTALLLATAHGLHQRMHTLADDVVDEALAGGVEAAEDII
jgi:hypothetical protein